MLFTIPGRRFPKSGIGRLVKGFLLKLVAECGVVLLVEATDAVALHPLAPAIDDLMHVIKVHRCAAPWRGDHGFNYKPFLPAIVASNCLRENGRPGKAPMVEGGE